MKRLRVLWELCRESVDYLFVSLPLILGFIYTGYVRFSKPELTETQLFIETLPAILASIGAYLVLVLISTFLAHTKEKDNGE